MKIISFLLFSCISFGQTSPGLSGPISANVTGTDAAGRTIGATQSMLNAIGYVGGSGTTQAQTATLVPGISSLTTGLSVCWLPNAANTSAAPTLSINGLTAKPITKLGTTALVANDITTTAISCAIYDGTEFQLQNPQTVSGGGGSGVCFIDLGPMGGYTSAGGITAPAWWSNIGTITTSSISVGSIYTGMVFTNSAATTDYAYRSFRFPRSCTPASGFTTEFLIWSSSSGNFQIGLSSACSTPASSGGSAGGPPSFPSQTISPTISITGGVANLYRVTFTSDFSGCSAGDTAWLRLNRQTNTLADWIVIPFATTYK